MKYVALLEESLRQQIDLEIQEKRQVRGISQAATNRFQQITMLQEQLACYIGERKAAGIVMDLYMERMVQGVERRRIVLRNKLTEISVRIFSGEGAEYCLSALRSHGCKVYVYSTRYEVVFPTGTMQEEILPRMYNCRYKILFPDGFEIEGLESRESGLYTLRFPISILPEHLQTQYKNQSR